MGRVQVSILRSFIALQPEPNPYLILVKLLQPAPKVGWVGLTCFALTHLFLMVWIKFLSLLARHHRQTDSLSKIVLSQKYMQKDRPTVVIRSHGR